jgi:hypothetical protein
MQMQIQARVRRQCREVRGGVRERGRLSRGQNQGQGWGDGTDEGDSLA